MKREGSCPSSSFTAGIPVWFLNNAPGPWASGSTCGSHHHVRRPQFPFPLPQQAKETADVEAQTQTRTHTHTHTHTVHVDTRTRSLSWASSPFRARYEGAETQNDRHDRRPVRLPSSLLSILQAHGPSGGVGGKQKKRCSSERKKKI